MSTPAETLPALRRSPAAGLTLLSVVISLVLLGAALAIVTYLYPPPSLEWLLLGGLALSGVLALAVARYNIAVAVGFLLLGVVRVEPAPPDFVFAVILAVAAVTGRFDVLRLPPVALVSVGALAVLSVLSAVEAVDPAGAARFLSITLFLSLFALWLAGYVDSASRARLVAVTYLIVAVVSAAIATLAVFVPFPGFEAFLQHGNTRASGLFNDPNVFGPFLIPIALILAQDTLRPRLFRMRTTTRLAALVILMLGILFSYSRGAWLALVLGFLVLVTVLIMRREGGPRLAAIGAGALAAAVIAALVVVNTGTVEFLEQRAAEQPYDTRRFVAQRAGVELAQSHPLGVGPGQFEPLINYAAHSAYVRVLTEQGIVGLLAFAMLALGTLWIAVQNTSRGLSTYGIGSAALLAAWSALLVNSFVIDTLHWRHLWIVAALIWAGAMAPASASPPRTPAGEAYERTAGIRSPR